MLGLLLETGSDRKHFVFIKRAVVFYIRYLRFAFGNRAGFVENDGIYFAGCFKRFATFDQNTMLSTNTS